MKLYIPDLGIPRVVIIGGGFAGLEVAKALKKAPVQVVLLDRNNYHVFQPLLYQVATAALEADPDAIIASGMDESRPEWLDEWNGFGSLQAVRNKALLHVHPDIIQRPTARIAQGASELCSKLDQVRTQPPEAASSPH